MGHFAKSLYSHPNIFLIITFVLNATILFGQNNSNWHTEKKIVSSSHARLYSEPTDTSIIVLNYKHLDEVLVLIHENYTQRFGWSKIVYPSVGYIKSSHLISSSQIPFSTNTQKGKQLLISTWEPKNFTCKQEYIFVKKAASYRAENIGVIKEDELILAIFDNRNEKNLWLKITYPIQGYIENVALLKEPSFVILDIGLYYGILHQPYEKNLGNYKNPFGSFISFSKTNWVFDFRLGYNHSKANIEKYLLKTEELYFNIHYKFLRFFENKLHFYGLVGVNYWFASFQNIKYPSFTDYCPEEKDKGIGYKLGAGLHYNFYNFFIALQYTFWASREAVFGNLPDPGEFTNQYKLYPGSNQFGIILGYKIIFD